MLETIFSPQSLAVVGASPDPERLGHVVLKNIIVNGYAGRIYPIHPSACLLYTSPSPRDRQKSRMPSSA